MLVALALVFELYLRAGAGPARRPLDRRAPPEPEGRLPDHVRHRRRAPDGGPGLARARNDSVAHPLRAFDLARRSSWSGAGSGREPPGSPRPREPPRLPEDRAPCPPRGHGQGPRRCSRSRRNDYALPADTVEELQEALRVPRFRALHRDLGPRRRTRCGRGRLPSGRRRLRGGGCRARRGLPGGHLLPRRAGEARHRLGRHLRRLLRRGRGGKRAPRRRDQADAGHRSEHHSTSPSRLFATRSTRTGAWSPSASGGWKLSIRRSRTEKVFELAKAEGLGSVPHAGEVAGPASIRGALDALQADRIDTASAPSRTRSWPSSRTRHLDVSPISNVRTKRRQDARRASAAEARGGGRALLDLDRRSRHVSTPISPGTTTPRAHSESIRDRPSRPRQRSALCDEGTREQLRPSAETSTGPN